MVRRRGNGWSKNGSKASRRQKRQARARQWYYAVAVGRRPGIFDLWKDAKAQVVNYSDCCHKKFLQLEDAQQFMRDNRVTPPGVRTMIPPATETPLPPPHLNPEYSTEFPDYEVTHAHQVHVDVEIPPLVPVAPIGTPESSFRHVRDIAQTIASKRSNRVLDPPNFECPHGGCGFSTGDLWTQRYLCLKRLYQLNAQLGHFDSPRRAAAAAAAEQNAADAGNVTDGSQDG